MYRHPLSIAGQTSARRTVLSSISLMRNAMMIYRLLKVRAAPAAKNTAPTTRSSTV